MVSIILLVAAAIVFLLAVIKVNSPINLVALGLLLMVVAQLFAGVTLHT